MNFYTEYNASLNNFTDVFNQYKVVKVTHDFEQEEEADKYFRSLAKLLGDPVIYEEDPIAGKIIPNKWTEIKFEKNKQFETYKHSNKFQPLHTDYGYYAFEIYTSFFYCVTQAEFGGATTFFDVDVLVNLLHVHDYELLLLLQSTLMHFGRNENPLTNFSGYIISKDTEGWKINWNYFRAQSDKNNVKLINRFKDFIDTYIEKSGELLEVKLKPLEGVFFKDRRVLHGRNSFIGNRHLNKGGVAVKIPAEAYKYVNKTF